MRAHLFELCLVYEYSWRNTDWERTWGDPSQGPSHQKRVPLAQQARAAVSVNACNQDACWFRGRETSKGGNYSQCREIVEAACRGAEDWVAWLWGKTAAEDRCGADSIAGSIRQCCWGREWAWGWAWRSTMGEGCRVRAHGEHALLLVAD